MATSLFPIIIPVSLLVISCLFLFYSKRAFLKSLLFSVAIIAGIYGGFLGKKFLLNYYAKNGGAAAQYQYARYCENMPEKINQWLIWPQVSDTQCGIEWLTRAANQGHAKAMYILGTHYLLQGRPNFDPVQGHKWLSKGRDAGFKPKFDTPEQVYWHEYRGED